MYSRILCFAILLAVVASAYSQEYCSFFTECPDSKCCRGILFFRSCKVLKAGESCRFCPRACGEGLECKDNKCTEKMTTAMTTEATTIAVAETTNATTSEVAETTVPTEVPPASGGV